MTDLESKNYIRVFFPKGITLDKPKDFKNYQKHEKESKYGYKLKSNLISLILKKNNIEKEETVQRLKKFLPNGYGDFHSITDKEYEALIKEFNL